jgi:hypothetical protein
MCRPTCRAPAPAARCACCALDASAPDAARCCAGWHGCSSSTERQLGVAREAAAGRWPGVRRSELPQLKDSDPARHRGDRHAAAAARLPRRRGRVAHPRAARCWRRRRRCTCAPARWSPTWACTSSAAARPRLVWVTTLDRGRPVAGAAVAVNDCRGNRCGTAAPTGAGGRARIERGFDDERGARRQRPRRQLRCRPATATRSPSRARTAPGDRSFVFSNWNRGIEAWRFGLPTQGWGRAAGDRLRPHGVRPHAAARRRDASMKHFVRDGNARRPRDVPPPRHLPDAVRITHAGSGDEVVLPLRLAAAARAAPRAAWSIAARARLGLYEVSLKNARHEWPAGQPARRGVPRAAARRAARGPAGAQVAPAVALGDAAQRHLNAGGPRRGRR